MADTVEIATLVIVIILLLFWIFAAYQAYQLKKYMETDFVKDSLKDAGDEVKNKITSIFKK